jgi:anaerobic ribonucleoside-triphosphate reductase activating protein
MMMPHMKDPGCRLENTVNLAGFIARSTVNGPGTRAVIWVQGCPIRCEGCFNTNFWSFTPKNQVPVGRLAERIGVLKNIDGVTFSGGEPFAQAGGLGRLGELVQDAGLSVVTYTGFTYDHILQKKRPAWQHLLSVTDLLISGPYVPSLDCRRTLIGSSNQKIIPLTSRIDFIPTESRSTSEDIELIVSRRGNVTATGFPGNHFVRHLAYRCNGG